MSVFNSRPTWPPPNSRNIWDSIQTSAKQTVVCICLFFCCACICKAAWLAGAYDWRLTWPSRRYEQARNYPCDWGKTACVCVCVIASFASSGGDALQAITVLCIIYSECARVCWADDLQRNKLLRWAQQFCGTISIVLADVCASWNFVHDRATSSARAIELRPECTHHNIALDTFSISSIKSCSSSQQQQQIHLNQQNTCVLFDVGNGVEWRRS